MNGRPVDAANDEDEDDAPLHLLDDDDEDDDPTALVTAGDLKFIFGFLKSFASPYATRIFAIIGVLVVDTIFNISFPLVQRWVIDAGLIERDWNVVITAIAFLCFAAVMVSGLGVLIDWQSSRVFAAMTGDIRARLFEKLQRVPLGFYQKNETGALLSRFSGDTVAVEHALVSFITELMLPLLEVIYASALMFVFNPWLGLLGAVIYPLVLFVPHYFARRAFGLGYEKRRQEARLMGAAQENIMAQPVVRAFDLAPRTQARFRLLGRTWLGTASRFNFAGALVERSTITSIYLVHLAVFGLGAYWAWEGVISVGTLVAFESMFLSMGEALTYVTHIVPTLAQAAGSMRHLDEVFSSQDEAQDPPDAIVLPRLQTDIRFENVGFGYPGGRFRIDGLNLDVPRGSKVAVVGASGSGKSTVLGLLLRLNDPDKGTVRFDGHDLRKVSRASLRGQMAVVFQESFLFDATIAENIRVGRADATDEEVEAAARAAEVHDFIVTLPKKYETKVGERGGRLSGGQKQRLAVARALVRDPAILLLDEATSALDAETESALLATLARAGKDRTIISVTHRLPTVTDSDLILVMERGKVRETGTHAELLAKSGVYARLWRKQAGNRRDA